MMRVIVFTGKGGVGKTTIAAATGVLVSERAKTLVMSTDPAHSLSDAFNTTPSNKPKEIAENLFIQEIDVNEEIRKNWGPIKQFFEGILMEKGLDEVTAEELSVFPGMEEVFSLIAMRDHFIEGSYDVIIMDCAPTAETLRLLSIPDVARWYTEKLLGLQGKVLKVATAIGKLFTDRPLPGEDAAACLEKLYINLEGVRKILTDSSTSSVRMVINPEKVVLRESLRMYTFLHLFGFSVDAIIVNRILPKIRKGFGKRWRKLQERYIEEAEASFYPVPIFYGIHLDREVVGIRRLKKLGNLIYGDKKPEDIFHVEKPLEIESENGKMVLKLLIPFVPKHEIKSLVRGSELTVVIKNFKRTFILPRALSERDLKEARYEDGYLKFYFE